MESPLLSETLPTIRIHVSSPGDVQEERNFLKNLVQELQVEIAGSLGVRLEFVSWEASAVLGFGRPQEVINRQIAPLDIFVGVLWARFGTPLKDGGSGTEEEIARALDSWKLLGRPHVMLYFSERPISVAELDVEQISRVQKLRKSLGEAGLYRTYRSLDEFRSIVRHDLAKLLQHLVARIEPSKRVPRVFYSYAHEDAGLREELAKHLRVLERKQIIESWYDNMIAPGAEWSEEIAVQLDKADIVIVLVSADFLDSDYCYTVEMKRALERHAAGKVCVIPVILRSALWEESPLAKLRALPKDGRAVVLWADRDEAWVDVTRGIRAVAMGLIAG